MQHEWMHRISMQSRSSSSFLNYFHYLTALRLNTSKPTWFLFLCSYFTLICGDGFQPTFYNAGMLILLSFTLFCCYFSDSFLSSSSPVSLIQSPQGKCTVLFKRCTPALHPPLRPTLPRPAPFSLPPHLCSHLFPGLRPLSYTARTHGSL